MHFSIENLFLYQIISFINIYEIIERLYNLFTAEKIVLINSSFKGSVTYLGVIEGLEILLIILLISIKITTA